MYAPVQVQGIVQSNLVRANFRGSTKFVLVIRSSSYQDIVIHVQYYSKPNSAQELLCVEQKFVLRVFILMRFYCIACAPPKQDVQLYNHTDAPPR